jgi:hypothetical protein
MDEAALKIQQEWRKKNALKKAKAEEEAKAKE